MYGFKIVKVENAEADDIITVLANKLYNQDKSRLIVIISNDNDYLQLVNDKTLIWSLQNKLLNSKVETTSQEMLMRKILRGDEGDNIPSIVGNMSEKDITELIQNRDKFESWLNTTDKRKLFENNQKLIDFNFIPNEIRESILEACKSWTN
jgi:5'-3' exonuclease